MKIDRTDFPYTFNEGSVTVKVYRVKNKAFKDNQEERFSYTVDYFLYGKRKQKMFADLDEAEEHAKGIAEDFGAGRLECVELRGTALNSYRHAMEALKTTCVPLEFAAREYAEAWKLLEGKGSLVEAARE